MSEIDLWPPQTQVGTCMYEQTDRRTHVHIIHMYSHAHTHASTHTHHAHMMYVHTSPSNIPMLRFHFYPNHNVCQ